MTRAQRQRVRGIILAIRLNEDQELAAWIARHSRKIAKLSNGRITQAEIREVLDPWVKQNKSKG